MNSKKAIFYDKFGSLYSAIIDSNSYSFNIKAYNKTNDVVANLMIDKENNNFFLEEIKCRREYRNRGIASKLLNLVDYLLKDYNGIIYGIFSPFDSNLSKLESNIVTKSFYEKNGYCVLPYASYNENNKDYKNIKKSYFTGTSRKYNNSIIVKEIDTKNNNMFIDNNNVLVEAKSRIIKKLV